MNAWVLLGMYPPLPWSEVGAPQASLWLCHGPRMACLRSSNALQLDGSASLVLSQCTKRMNTMKHHSRFGYGRDWTGELLRMCNTELLSSIKALPHYLEFALPLTRVSLGNYSRFTGAPWDMVASRILWDPRWSSSWISGNLARFGCHRDGPHGIFQDPKWQCLPSWEEEIVDCCGLLGYLVSYLDPQVSLGTTAIILLTKGYRMVR